jgi:hypothetical protein
VNVLPALRDKLQGQFDVAMLDVPTSDFHFMALIRGPVPAFITVLRVELAVDSHLMIAQDDNLLKIRLRVHESDGSTYHTHTKSIAPIDMYNDDFFEQLLRVIRIYRL